MKFNCGAISWPVVAIGCLALIFVAFFACDKNDDDDDDDTGDGGEPVGDTWIDPSSGLTWQVEPSAEYMIWVHAEPYCENLALAGGGWHLPSISELRTLIRGCDATATGGPCGVTDSCLGYDCTGESCYDCDEGGGPNNGCFGPAKLAGECEWYWSSSRVAGSTGGVWSVGFEWGCVENGGTSFSFYVRCVR